MDNYSFHLFWSEEDGCYVAVSPEFSGISALGETANDALEELRTALRLTIETYKEEGWVLPKPEVQGTFSGQFRVRVPKTLHALLVRLAQTENVSLNTLIVNYLSRAVGHADVLRLLKDVRTAGDTVAQVLPRR